MSAIRALEIMDTGPCDDADLLHTNFWYEDIAPIPLLSVEYSMSYLRAICSLIFRAGLSGSRMQR